MKPKVNKKLAKTRVNSPNTLKFARTLSLTLQSKFSIISALFSLCSNGFAAIPVNSSTNSPVDSPSTAPQKGSFHNFGPFYDRYPAVDGSVRTEVLGPLFGWETKGSSSLFRFTPVFSLYEDSRIPQTEFEMAYPVLTLDRFGEEFRLQLGQIFSWAGGQSIQGGETKRTTIFPIFFQQRSPDPQKNYTAVFPFYGHLKNRIFRNEIFFIMFPIYLQTMKRGFTTYNYLFPLFHHREGPGLKGWQFWPLVGHEKKEITTSTNNWGDVQVSGGHEKFFALWPLYFKNTLGIGTTNVQNQFVLIPFYSSQVASNRVSKTYGFPLGYTHTIDHDRQYEEHDAPWPLAVFARGPGKTVNRVWPFFGQAKSRTLQSDFYAWPIYKYNRITAEMLDRERTRILLFLYSDTRERDLTNNTALLRRDFWPLYTWRKDHQNNERLQVLSVLEPILPNNKSIERLYSPAYAIWRSEKNGVTGDSSKSLLWNLYREERRAEVTKQVAFFGLFQREKRADHTRWRIFFIPFTKRIGNHPNLSHDDTVVIRLER